MKSNYVLEVRKIHQAGGNSGIVFLYAHHVLADLCFICTDAIQVIADHVHVHIDARFVLGDRVGIGRDIALISGDLGVQSSYLAFSCLDPLTKSLDRGFGSSESVREEFILIR